MAKPLIRLVAPIAVASSLLLSAPAAFGAATDPGTVFASFFAALGSGNTTAMAALLAPTVTWNAGPAQAYPPNFPLTATGLTAVGTLLAQEQAAKVTLTLVGTPTVSGNNVAFTANLSDPALTTLGVPSVKVDGTATVTSGQIASVTTTVDPASAAALAKAYGTAATAGATAPAAGATAPAAAAASAPALPKTGANPLTWLASLLLLAIGGVLGWRRPSAARRGAL